MDSSPKIGGNLLHISWQDSDFPSEHLNAANALDYFCQPKNPFYDTRCNNEHIRMQRLGMEHMVNMIGFEFCLLHAQEPILYIVRKQRRESPTIVVPVTNYYIIAGKIFQSPDLSAILSTRLLNSLSSIQSAFSEAYSHSRYDSTRGYWWDFGSTASSTAVERDETPAEGATEAPSASGDGDATTSSKAEPPVVTAFQAQATDQLLKHWSQKMAPRGSHDANGTAAAGTRSTTGSRSIKSDRSAGAASQRSSATTVGASAAQQQQQQQRDPPDKRARFLK